MGMFPAAREPLPFETETDRFRHALALWAAKQNQPAEEVVEQPKEEEEEEEKPKAVIVWETVNGKRVPRRVA